MSTKSGRAKSLRRKLRRAPSPEKGHLSVYVSTASGFGEARSGLTWARAWQILNDAVVIGMEADITFTLHDETTRLEMRQEDLSADMFDALFENPEALRLYFPIVAGPMLELACD